MEYNFTTLKHNLKNDDFRCPRCGHRMQEPRLLPCLHPICSSCVNELINRMSYASSNEKQTDERSAETHVIYERCPLCNFRLPNANLFNPPPHYPLQHRLIMEAIRCRKLTHRVLCDICPDEILALVQCTACLRNFCAECGAEHQNQITMEMKASKHSVRPLWEATRVRRTALCQIHPSHALRYYCIACQQITCRECMWSVQHRGHASESAIGAGKRIAAYLAKVLQRAGIFLNSLLTQYDHNPYKSMHTQERDSFDSINLSIKATVDMRAFEQASNDHNVKSIRNKTND